VRKYTGYGWSAYSPEAGSCKCVARSSDFVNDEKHFDKTNHLNCVKAEGGEVSKGNKIPNNNDMFLTYPNSSFNLFMFLDLKPNFLS